MLLRAHPNTQPPTGALKVIPLRLSDATAALAARKLLPCSLNPVHREWIGPEFFINEVACGQVNSKRSHRYLYATPSSST